MATPADVLKDPKFYGLPPEERTKVLSALDPRFTALPQVEQMKVVNHGADPATSTFAPGAVSTAEGEASGSRGPGLGERALQGLGVPTSGEAALQSTPLAGPVNIYRAVRDYNPNDNVSSMGKVLEGAVSALPMGGMAAGAMRGLREAGQTGSVKPLANAVPILGPVVEDASHKNWEGLAGTGLALAAQMAAPHLVPEAVSAAAEGRVPGQGLARESAVSLGRRLVGESARTEKAATRVGQDPGLEVARTPGLAMSTEKGMQATLQAAQDAVGQRVREVGNAETALQGKGVDAMGALAHRLRMTPRDVIDTLDTLHERATTARNVPAQTAIGQILAGADLSSLPWDQAQAFKSALRDGLSYETERNSPAAQGLKRMSSAVDAAMTDTAPTTGPANDRFGGLAKAGQALESKIAKGKVDSGISKWEGRLLLSPLAPMVAAEIAARKLITSTPVLSTAARGLYKLGGGADAALPEVPQGPAPGVTPHPPVPGAPLPGPAQGPTPGVVGQPQIAPPQVMDQLQQAMALQSALKAAGATQGVTAPGQAPTVENVPTSAAGGPARLSPQSMAEAVQTAQAQAPTPPQPQPPVAGSQLPDPLANAGGTRPGPPPVLSPQGSQTPLPGGAPTSPGGFPPGQSQGLIKMAPAAPGEVVAPVPPRTKYGFLEDPIAGGAVTPEVQGLSSEEYGALRAKISEVVSSLSAAKAKGKVTQILPEGEGNPNYSGTGSDFSNMKGSKMLAGRENSKAGTPLVNFREGPKVLQEAWARDKGNALERRILQAFMDEGATARDAKAAQGQELYPGELQDRLNAGDQGEGLAGTPGPPSAPFTPTGEGDLAAGIPEGADASFDPNSFAAAMRRATAPATMPGSFIQPSPAAQAALDLINRIRADWPNQRR